MNGEPTTENPKIEKLDVVKTNTENSISREPSTEKPTTKQLISEEVPTENLKIVTSNTEAPEIVEPKIDEQRFKESISEESSDLDKTYGMSLTGDQGIVWNVSNIIIIL